MSDVKKSTNELLKMIRQVESLLSDIRKEVQQMSEENKSIDYTQLEGITGKYDGFSMICDDGTRYEVPQNYAAKTKIVYGDVLKLIEQDGKKLFKQVVKVDRIKVDGILTKKEGEWYLLTDRGSYRVSGIAADFQRAQLNSEATAFLPQDNLNAPFATLDKVEGFIKDNKEPANRVESVKKDDDRTVEHRVENKNKLPDKAKTPNTKRGMVRDNSQEGRPPKRLVKKQETVKPKVTEAKIEPKEEKVPEDRSQLEEDDLV